MKLPVFNNPELQHELKYVNPVGFAPAVSCNIHRNVAAPSIPDSPLVPDEPSLPLVPEEPELPDEPSEPLVPEEPELPLVPELPVPPENCSVNDEKYIEFVTPDGSMS